MRVHFLMSTDRETFTLSRSDRCIFKGRGIREYGFPVKYTIEECLDEYCLVRGWKWITLIKTAVKGGSEWGYFTYKIVCPNVSYQNAWGYRE